MTTFVRAKDCDATGTVCGSVTWVSVDNLPGSDGFPDLSIEDAYLISTAVFVLFAGIWGYKTIGRFLSSL